MKHKKRTKKIKVKFKKTLATTKKISKLAGKKFVDYFKYRVEQERKSRMPASIKSKYKTKIRYKKVFKKNKRGYYKPVYKKVKVRVKYVPKHSHTTSRVSRPASYSTDVFGNKIDAGYLGGGF